MCGVPTYKIASVKQIAFLLFTRRRDFYSKMLSCRPAHEFKCRTQISKSIIAKQYLHTSEMAKTFCSWGSFMPLHQLSIKYSILARVV